MKKKAGKSNRKEVSVVLSDMKKSSKSNQLNTFSVLNALREDEEPQMDEESGPESNQIPNVGDPELDVGKSNKKEKKKGGKKRKTAQEEEEEEDLDKILAELREEENREQSLAPKNQKSKNQKKKSGKRKNKTQLKKKKEDEQNRSESARQQISLRINENVKTEPTQVESQQEIVELEPTVEIQSHSTEIDATSRENQKSTELRAPICCILGHADSGKTKLLDYIRETNAHQNEAGNITQQVGVTFFPIECIKQRTKELKADATLKVPGLLVIDTPGHQAFSNLRYTGSSVCDIAILVVDIMKGIEPQTVESIKLLTRRNAEFIVALNKVDRLYGWKKCLNVPIVKALKQQNKDVKNEFDMRVTEIVTQFKEQGLNMALYYKNKDMGETLNIVPTSALSGEGIPNLLLLLVQRTQKTMAERLTYTDEVQCTVFEVKKAEGHHTTIDVILANGTLHKGDQIVLCGINEPIVTNIRALHAPHPMRVNGEIMPYDQLKAAQCIRIDAAKLDHVIAGTALYVAKPGCDLETLTDLVMQEPNMTNRISRNIEGVFVNSPTLASLQSLIEMLQDVKIPISGFAVGPVHKKHVIKASAMLAKKREYGIIVAFDVKKVIKEVEKFATESGVEIFQGNEIFQLVEKVKKHVGEVREARRRENADLAVFPCELRILRDEVFNKKDPIILGVEVLDGILKERTPICIPAKDFMKIGRIEEIKMNDKQVNEAKKGKKVTIKIVGRDSEEKQKMVGRHFDIDDQLVSHITRQTIDILTADYRDELSVENVILVEKLRREFNL